MIRVRHETLSDTQFFARMVCDLCECKGPEVNDLLHTVAIMGAEREATNKDWLDIPVQKSAGLTKTVKIICQRCAQACAAAIEKAQSAKNGAKNGAKV